MSNVLIGIIGVILFIGLALAGALILGDDFQSANSSAKASALMSQLKQAADAAEMRKLKLGVSTTPATSTDFLVPRFLKTPAINPTHLSAADPTNTKWTVAFNNNMVGDGYYEPTYAAKFVQAVIGPRDDARARRICQEIESTYGRNGVEDVSTTADPTGDAGCALTAVNVDNYGNQPHYVAYVRVAPRTQNYLMLVG